MTEPLPGAVSSRLQQPRKYSSLKYVCINGAQRLPLRVEERLVGSPSAAFRQLLKTLVGSKLPLCGYAIVRVCLLQD